MTEETNHWRAKMPTKFPIAKSDTDSATRICEHNDVEELVTRANAELDALRAQLVERDALIRELEEYTYELSGKKSRRRPTIEIVVGETGPGSERLGLSLLRDTVNVSLERLGEDREVMVSGYRTTKILDLVRLRIEIETDDRGGRVTNLVRALHACGAEVSHG